MQNLPSLRGAFSAKAAQCPNCFSFNSPDYLPPKKLEQRDSELLLTCATCGTPYSSQQLPQAA